ncbi:hypothetical protein L2Y96_02450 [Luteibacter aegosomaticola]|uniref:hypothetical protein n=1 Tax=Luteibacter aegosomaticola TaxID=2911538 RepID=UPI001FF71374|nr:hypothetical protein [Luteibacter aegosomaticola]UPG90653.1 hypothetical protein L2Y96_02450 [Luteibacter aegosomaticola]
MIAKRFLVSVVACLVTAPAIAHDWRVQSFGSDPNNVVMPAVLDAFRFYAEPASVWYLEQLNGALVPYNKFMIFHGELSRATYAAFEYTFMQNGRNRTRIYYAMSGPNDPRTGLAGAPPHLSSYVVEDATRVYSFASSADRTTLMATQLEDEPSSAIHARDAEFKALRTIERDIQRHTVTRGGTLHAFISQPMCDSCEHVMHRFSDIYGVDINVNHLEGNMSESYYRFRGVVQGFLNTLLVRVRGAARPAPGTGQGPGPGPTPPPPAGMCARIFAE